MNHAFSAVEKHSSDLVRYLSSGIVDINEFGVKLVSAQFTGSSALNNALSGTGVSISEKATLLCLIVSTQIELEPGKYFKKFLKILNGYSSINQLDEKISEEYGTCCPLCCAVLLCSLSVYIYNIMCVERVSD